MYHVITLDLELSKKESLLNKTHKQIKFKSKFLKK